LLRPSLGYTSVFFYFSSFGGLKSFAENDVEYAELRKERKKGGKNVLFSF